MTSDSDSTISECTPHYPRPPLVNDRFLTRVMSFVSVRSGTSCSSSRRGSSVADRWSPELANVCHKPVQGLLPSLLLGGNKTESILALTTARTNRSEESERTSKYQVSEFKHRSASVFSNEVEGPDQEASLAGHVNVPDIYERDVAWNDGDHQPQWAMLDVHLPGRVLDLGYELAMLLVPLLLLSVCVGVIVWHFGAADLKWDFYAITGVAVFITVWQTAAAMLQVRALLIALGMQLAPLMHSRSDDLPPPLARDRRVAYVQATLQNAQLQCDAVVVDSDCLNFMRAELKELDASANGFVIIDPTGIIVYCNEVLCAYFGYDRADLLQENVRLLMPLPYSRQHDQFLRHHAANRSRRMLDSERPVPVIDVNGKQSIVKLRVTERCDPNDADNKVFVGRMKFHEALKVAEALRQRLASGAYGVEAACQCFDMFHDYIWVMDARGTIEFVNYPVTQLLGYGVEELKGRAVSTLLPGTLNKLGDDFLTRFSGKAEAGGGCSPREHLNNAMQEVVLRSKNNEELKAYLHLERVDWPGQIDGYLLVCNAILRPEVKHHLTETGHALGSFPSSCTSGTSDNSSTSSIRGRLARSSHSRGSHRSSRNSASGYLSRLHLGVKKCSLVVMDVFGMQHNLKTLAAEYEALMLLVMQSCSRHKAHVHTVLGDRIVLTLNAALTNNSHRSSVGSLMAHLTTSWNTVPGHASLRMLAAAVTQEMACGSFGHQNVIISEAVDVCTAMLRIGIEGRVANALIDAALHEELQYLYECRLVNFITIHPRDKRSHVRPIYELHSVKQLTSEEWMYQVTQDVQQPRMLKWTDCWSHLCGHKSNLGYAQPSLAPNYGAALEALAAHLVEHSTDSTASWLQMVLKRRLAQPLADAVPLVELSGKLQFFMLYRLPEKPLLGTGVSSKLRNEDNFIRPRRSQPDVSSNSSRDRTLSLGDFHGTRQRLRDNKVGTDVASECSVISDTD